MNKALKAYEKIYQAQFGGVEKLDKEFAIIKTELKDCKIYKTIYPLMKAKLDKVRDDKLKLQKALEILKEWFEVFEDENGYHLRTLFDIGGISKEQFDLLKEVLK